MLIVIRDIRYSTPETLDIDIYKCFSICKLFVEGNTVSSILIHLLLSVRSVYISVQNTNRVVKMVLNTHCYLYLWLTMWFHAKNPKKHSKIRNRRFYYKFGSQAQKRFSIRKHFISKAIFKLLFLVMWYDAIWAMWRLTSSLISTAMFNEKLG